MIDNSLSLFPRIKFIESGTSINSSLLKDGPGMPSQSRDSGGSRWV